MSSRLINVRLDEDRVRKVRRLRERGVALSDLVREAIDARFEATMADSGSQSAKTLIARLLEQFPDPPDTKARSYDVHDAKQARAAIRRTIRKRRR